MVKVKMNICSMIGAVLCLVSMLFAYLQVNALVTEYSISWKIMAQYANYGFYAVPVIGVLMLLGGLTNAKFLKRVSVLLAVVFIAYYFISFRNLLNGEVMKRLSGISDFAGIFGANVDFSSLGSATSGLSDMLKSGIGIYMFIGGTVVGAIGMLIGNKE